MPSLVHDGMVRLFHARPDLAPTLVRDVLGVALPAYTSVRIESADLTDIAPAPRHADAVVVLRTRRRPVHAQIVEVQLAVDPDKLSSWPAYATNLRGRLGCDVELLVVTPHRAVARGRAADPHRARATSFVCSSRGRTGSRTSRMRSGPARTPSSRC